MLKEKKWRAPVYISFFKKSDGQVGSGHSDGQPGPGEGIGKKCKILPFFKR
jgi:hypothetical protein